MQILNVLLVYDGGCTFDYDGWYYLNVDDYGQRARHGYGGAWSDYEGCHGDWDLAWTMNEPFSLNPCWRNYRSRPARAVNDEDRRYDAVAGMDGWVWGKRD